MALAYCLFLAVFAPFIRADLAELSAITDPAFEILITYDLEGLLTTQEQSIDGNIALWTRYCNLSSTNDEDVVSNCTTNSCAYPCPTLEIIAGDESTTCYFYIQNTYGTTVSTIPIAIYATKPSLCIGSVPSTCSSGDNCQNARTFYTENTPFTMYTGPPLAELDSTIYNVYCTLGRYCVAGLSSVAVGLTIAMQFCHII